MLYAAELAKMPVWSPARCVARDGATNPLSWGDGIKAIQGAYSKGRDAYGSFSKAFSGQGGATGVLGNLWEGAKSLGGAFSNVFGLFGREETVARMFLGMHPDRRKLLWTYIKEHDCPPTDEECAKIINYQWYLRKTRKALPPPEFHLEDKKSADDDVVLVEGRGYPAPLPSYVGTHIPVQRYNAKELAYMSAHGGDLPEVRIRE